MVVDRTLGDARTRRNAIHAGRIEARRQKFLDCRVDDRGTLAVGKT
ncbi:Outer membrane protein romA [Caballeronia sordidicola]|uniref:Outer membrane protein romA n=1 Tax=Caballeronia sordidicola TaxID=196367 RepID=A0A242MHI5_CABSO|nr:Outer membrane protein romA [Caballeronia sordidicola]